MKTGAISCLIMAGVFGSLALLFTLLKAKATSLVSGFNTLPKEERERYDQEKMSRAQRNAFLVWTAVFIAGAVASYLIRDDLAIITFIAWLILFFKDVHLDADRAFGKYRK